MTANRTTKAERRAAKEVLAAWRKAARRIDRVYGLHNFMHRLRQRGVAEQARRMRQHPPAVRHWWFRGTVAPDSDGTGFVMTADPKGDRILNVTTGTTTAAPPPPKPTWSAEFTLKFDDVDQDALGLLLP
jgi:hypothetical protein